MCMLPCCVAQPFRHAKVWVDGAYTGTFALTHAHTFCFENTYVHTSLICSTTDWGMPWLKWTTWRNGPRCDCLLCSQACLCVCVYVCVCLCRVVLKLMYLHVLVKVFVPVLLQLCLCVHLVHCNHNHSILCPTVCQVVCLESIAYTPVICLFCPRALLYHLVPHVHLFHCSCSPHSLLMFISFTAHVHLTHCSCSPLPLLMFISFTVWTS